MIRTPVAFEPVSGILYDANLEGICHVTYQPGFREEQIEQMQEIVNIINWSAKLAKRHPEIKPCPCPGIEKYKALCRQLAEACTGNVGVLKTWAQHCKLIGVHCLTTDKAIKDSEAALEAAKKAKVIDG